MSEGVRIDRWLWATRIFKTRPQATEACQGEHVKIDGLNAKPSRQIRPGDVIEIRRPDIVKTVRVKDLAVKRVGAGVVDRLLEDLTPPSEYERQKEFRTASIAKRERGTGRPTKKERRETDRLLGTDFFD